jgi:hypothetical protein
MRDTAQERLAKIAQLVTFLEDEDGNLQIQSIRGDVHGELWGSVYGNVVGNISGDVVGTVFCDVHGGVVGAVMGSVGEVKGSVGGNHAASVKERIAQLEIENQGWYERQVEIFNRPAT